MNSPREREQDLVGKVALVTGASRGIGHAVAVNLASRGCAILGTCSSDKNIHLITEIERRLPIPDKQRNSNRKVIGIVADMYSSDLHSQLADALQKNFAGRLDIFVNNAGDPMPAEIGMTTSEEIDRSLVANIRNPVLVVDELVKRKIFRPESRIIYISSVRSRQPWSEQLMYAATKSAGESLCRTWSQAFGGREQKFAFMQGTTANAVTVGLTETDAVVDCGEQAVEGFKAEFLPLQSIPRMGQPEDVADVVGMLCGRDARWITGTVVSASGGGVKIG